MIVGRLGKRGRMTVPQAVRSGLDLRAGDVLVFSVEGDKVVMSRAMPPCQFGLFTEWAGEADRLAYSGL